MVQSALYKAEGELLDNPQVGLNDEIGPFQITYAFWMDAVEWGYRKYGEDPDGHRFSMCWDYTYSEKILRWYMERRCPEAWENGDAETIARIFNGGPRGAEKEATLAYWHKVEAILESMPK